MDVALSAIGIFLVFFGVVGLLIPFVPDVPFVASGVMLLLIAQHVLSPVLALALLGLTILAFLTDWLLVLYGARKLGATRAGQIGGTIGMSFIGTPLGFLPGLVLFPAAGAMIGELIGRRHDHTYKKIPLVGVGVGVFAAFTVTIKLILIALMIGVGLLGLGLRS